MPVTAVGPTDLPLQRRAASASVVLLGDTGQQNRQGGACSSPPRPPPRAPGSLRALLLKPGESTSPCPCKFPNFQPSAPFSIFPDSRVPAIGRVVPPPTHTHAGPACISDFSPGAGVQGLPSALVRNVTAQCPAEGGEKCSGRDPLPTWERWPQLESQRLGLDPCRGLDPEGHSRDLLAVHSTETVGASACPLHGRSQALSVGGMPRPHPMGHWDFRAGLLFPHLPVFI